MVEKGIMEVSMPFYDPNRGKLNPREIYAILHVVFADNGTPTKDNGGLNAGL